MNIQQGNLQHEKIPYMLWGNNKIKIAISDFPP